MSVFHNEQTKYIANAFDRASTSCLTVGVFAPIAAAFYAPVGAVASTVTVVVVGSCWFFAAAVLQLSVKYTLRGLL
ncbi:hypothetical protein ACRQ1B_21320 [Rhizobium panacihumi]|uniref:hypothetical protein n=1 Tax=Rhizobium panacihumi TaxID=2008450 RepID=UPI003D78CFCA